MLRSLWLNFEDSRCSMSREIILLAVSRKYKIYHILDPLATPKFYKSILLAQTTQRRNF